MICYLNNKQVIKTCLLLSMIGSIKIEYYHSILNIDTKQKHYHEKTIQ